MHRKYLFFFLFLIPVMAFGAVVNYKTHSGDTIQSTASAVGMTVQEFATANPNARLVSNQSFSAGTPDPVPPTPTGETRFTAYLTSYAAGDNSPPGTGTYISGIAGNAGGTGTYDDPITMAVGYVGQTPDYPAGTMFYVPNVQRYFKAGDTCASCHKGKAGLKWLDMYSGDYSGAGILACENSVTGNYLVIQNPATNYKVTVGSIYNGSTCSTQFGNNIITN